MTFDDLVVIVSLSSLVLCFLACGLLAWDISRAMDRRGLGRQERRFFSESYAPAPLIRWRVATAEEGQVERQEESVFSKELLAPLFDAYGCIDIPGHGAKMTLSLLYEGIHMNRRRDR